jgi:iron(III) transport system ATP-binding protein
MSAYAIRCQNLAKSYDGEPAVCGVDIEVEPGQFMALLGPSGCGKTTMLRLIAGLDRPDRGTVEISGDLVSGPDRQVPPEKRHVGMVFQEYALFPHLSLAANVAYGLSRNGDRRERVNAALEMVGLAHLGHRMPHELSGGQQQRVALARALAPNPHVILLDEPFSNLDASLRERLREEVRTILRQAGVTVIFVTHDQEEALSLADHVAVMMEGEILQSGTPRHVYLHPADHLVATFLGEANYLPAVGTGLVAECEIGSLQAMQPLDGKGEVMFRPEDLIVSPTLDGPCKVVDMTYFGHDQLLTIELPSGHHLRGRLLGSRDDFKVGQPVDIHVDTPVNVFPTRFGCPDLSEPKS